MSKFLKDKKINILQLNEQTERYEVTKANAWAYIRHMSAKETYTAGVAESGWRVLLFIINIPKFEMTTYDRIQYKGESFNILSIDDYDGRTNQLKIMAKGRY